MLCPIGQSNEKPPLQALAKWWEYVTPIREMPTGRGFAEKLTLQRKNNKFDDNAVMILTANKKKLGYIPEKDNLVFARLMDAGKLLIARISSIQQKGSFTQIGIGIYLVDF